MKTKFLFLLSMVVVLFACDSNSFEDVSLMEESSDLNKSSSSNNSYILMSASNKLPGNLGKSVAAAKGSITNTIPEIGIAVVSSDDPEFASKASKIQGIQSVVPDFEVQGRDPEMKTVKLDGDFGNPPYSGDDDFLFDLQWGHDAIDAPEAWNAGHRGEGVTVFVLDEGIEANHPDLKPNLNFSLSTSFVPGESWDVEPGIRSSHGTHVAGTIAAADNGFGVIGVAPEAELVAVKVLSDYTGSGAYSWIIAGIIYAANNDADIINMSLGGLALKSSGSEVALLKNAMNRATTYAYQRGSTVIVAAGNEGLDRDHLTQQYFPGASSLTVLPADGPNVVQISATAPIGWALDPDTFLDTPTSYTNYGQSAIDLAGPGGDGAYPGNEFCKVGIATAPCWAFDLVFSTDVGAWFSWKGGTSMAAPHAAGVAALIIGKNGGSMKPAHVISALKRSADDLGKPGKDDYYGNGRVNAYNAVTQ